MTRHNQATPSPYSINRESKLQLDHEFGRFTYFGLSLNMEQILRNSDSGSSPPLDTA